MQIDLKSGHRIDIVPVQGLKAKHRDAYEGAPKLYMKFDDKGNPDFSDLPISMSLSKVQRNGLLAALISQWTFVDDAGNPLPVPVWTGYDIENAESFGEIPLDDMTEIEGLLEPYLEKIARKPDPKTMTTGSSTDASKDKADSPTV